MVEARCEKFLLSVITFKIFELECSTMSQNKDHKKDITKYSKSLWFQWLEARSYDAI